MGSTLGRVFILGAHRYSDALELYPHKDLLRTNSVDRVTSKWLQRKFCFCFRRSTCCLTIWVSWTDLVILLSLIYISYATIKHKITRTIRIGLEGSHVFHRSQELIRVKGSGSALVLPRYPKLLSWILVLRVATPLWCCRGIVVGFCVEGILGCCRGTLGCCCGLYFAEGVAPSRSLAFSGALRALCGRSVSVLLDLCYVGVGCIPVVSVWVGTLQILLLCVLRCGLGIWRRVR